jgi:branched-chain amino acid transport system substrate-binding protein
VSQYKSLLLLLFALSLAVTGCSSEQASLAPAPVNTVRIVSSLPSRGVFAGQTKAIAEAIRQAIAERNAMAGGWHIEYVPMEGGSDETGEWSRERELENATMAADDPSVIAYIGPYNSGAARVSLPVTNRAGLLQASPSATWPGLTLPGWDEGEPQRYFPSGTPNFVRLMPPDSVLADAAAQWMGALHLSRVLILEDGSSYSAGLANEFSSAASAARISVTGRMRILPPTIGNVHAEAGGSEAIFYAPSTIGNAQAVAKKLQGAPQAVFATDTALDPQLIEQGGESTRNWFILSNSAAPNTSGKYSPRTWTNIETQFANQFAANAYSLTSLILDALEAGTGRDRSALLRYIRSARLPGDSRGAHFFTATGDPTRWNISGYRWNGAEFRLVRSFEEAQSP